MSLYLEAARFLLPPTPFQASPSVSASKDSTSKSTEELENDSGGLSLASRIFSQKDKLRNSPGHIFKVVVETRKWDAVLAAVIEVAEVLERERKLTPELSLVLTHDLLLSPNGIAAPKSHALVTAITRHKARLSSEFTRARVKAGFASIEAWKDSLLSGQNNATEAPRPRWARINALKISKEQVLSNPFFSGYTQVHDLASLQTQKNVYFLDTTIPFLLALPPSLDLTKTELYKRGHLILQDKASCIPAYLLNHTTDDGDIIDACAAPGNKTSHLAALMTSNNAKQSLYACERDAQRSKTLRKMLDTAGADSVNVLESTDFLTLDPNDARFSNVTSILLDPSCSGSGMLGRDEDVEVTLPRRKSEIHASSSSATSSHRKEKNPDNNRKIKPSEKISNSTTGTASKSKDPQLSTRLRNLANLQLRLLQHAFSFPSARKVAYSTCSIHAEENEGVVLRALSSDIAQARKWRVLRREEQISGLQRWRHRGMDIKTLQNGGGGGDVSRDLLAGYIDEVRDACIRCHKGDGEGTMGFFAVCFVRDAGSSDVFGIEHNDYGNGNGAQAEEAEETDGDNEKEEEEWQGFSSDSD